MRGGSPGGWRSTSSAMLAPPSTMPPKPAHSTVVERKCPNDPAWLAKPPVEIVVAA